MKKFWKYLGTLGLMLLAFLCLGIGIKTSDVSFGATAVGEMVEGGVACVDIKNGKHEMNGGTIGGKDYGVYIAGGTFTMSGGSISNCSKYGVYVDGGTFNMNGGTISNCSQYGVYVNVGTFNYSSGTISNEIYLTSSKYITLKKAPTSTLKIRLSSTSSGTRVAYLSGISSLTSTQLSYLNVVNMPSGYKLEVQSGYVVIVKEATITYYTVTISAGTGGRVSQTSVSVPSGTTYTTDGNLLSFSDGTRVIASANSGYAFSYWTPSYGTINSSTTIYVYFESLRPQPSLDEFPGPGEDKLTIGLDVNRQASPYEIMILYAVHLCKFEGYDIDRFAWEDIVSLMEVNGVQKLSDFANVFADIKFTSELADAFAEDREPFDFYLANYEVDELKRADSNVLDGELSGFLSMLNEGEDSSAYQEFFDNVPYEETIWPTNPCDLIIYSNIELSSDPESFKNHVFVSLGSSAFFGNYLESALGCHREFISGDELYVALQTDVIDFLIVDPFSALGSIDNQMYYYEEAASYVYVLGRGDLASFDGVGLERISELYSCILTNSGYYDIFLTMRDLWFDEFFNRKENYYESLRDRGYMN